MSKVKVDAYREQKKHRKENLAKERAQKKMRKIVGWVVMLVIVVGILAGIGVTGWNQYKAYKASIPDYTTTEQVVNDYSGVTSMSEADAELEEDADAILEEDAEVETEAETEAE